MKVFRPIRLLSGERGATSIEYAILGSLIAAVIVFAVTTLGTQVRTLFETVQNAW
ncbi:MAG: Flp family type IVb pilin [Phycisphaerae bacterium]|nr:Flp family type IVb pilin [Phycisphaerae bacterium]